MLTRAADGATCSTTCSPIAHPPKVSGRRDGQGRTGTDEESLRVTIPPARGRLRLANYAGGPVPLSSSRAPARSISASTVASA